MAQLALAVPVRPGSQSGNDVTGARWALRLRELGHQVELIEVDPDQAPPVPSPDAEVLIALHARRCADVVAAWVTDRPDLPCVVGLAGTDLYVDLPDDSAALASLRAAHRLVVLQPRAIETLGRIGATFAQRARTIFQSVDQSQPTAGASGDDFVACVPAALRAVKDPMMSARAARLMSSTSKLRVDGVGAAHSSEWARRATEETETNDRYRWHGELPHRDTLAMMAASHVVACTSTSEGGANSVTEAIALGVPVVGTAIDGNIGLLGDSYPGLVPVGDDHALAGWLDELERSPDLLGELRECLVTRRWITEPDNERATWAELLAEFGIVSALTEARKRNTPGSMS